jgi:hypothetical protein
MWGIKLGIYQTGTRICRKPQAAVRKDERQRGTWGMSSLLVQRTMENLEVTAPNTFFGKSFMLAIGWPSADIIVRDGGVEWGRSG